MATNAVRRRPGRMARAIHWLFPNREHVVITIAVEMALAASGLPLWAHLLLGALIHLILILARAA